MLRDVFLHGHLGERFGRHRKMDVASPAEAVRALCSTLPGFREAIRQGAYRITRGRDMLQLDELGIGLGRRCKTVHIIPTPQQAGLEIPLIAWILVGVAVVAVAALAFMPTLAPTEAKDREDDKNSFIFDGAVNGTEQGGPFPLIFGRWRVGSTVGSVEIATTDVPASALTGAQQTPGFNNSPLSDDLIRAWLIFGKGGKGGGSARAAQEDPNTLQSQATAKIIDILGEGEIEGLVDGLKSVYFDDTPVQNADGTYNFKGVAIEERVGLPSQPHVPGHTAASNLREIRRPLTTAIGPIVETISDPDVNRARVTIALTSLFEQDTKNGDMKKLQLEYKIELQSNGGGYTEVVRQKFNDKTTSRYQKSHDILLPAGGHPWDIRVSRVTPDRTAANFSDDLEWDLLQEITDAKLTYPDTAYISLIYDAKQHGSKIATRSYDVRGLIVDVPTNFDPETGEYATTGPGTTGGQWDGTFKRAWTDEGVWCFREMLLHKRWGLGRRIGEQNVDKWTLYAIAQRNAGLVPDGQGGWERRHTLNAYITTQEQAHKVLQTMAASWRSMPFWADGMISLAQDAPADPERLVTPANVIDGKFNYETTDVEDQQYSAFIVAYNNPEDGYRLDFEVVEDPELRARIGWKSVQVTAWGETRRGGAIRYGRWKVSDQRLSERVTYKAGFDQADMLPEEVIAIQDPKEAGKDWGGRLRDSTTTSATLDRSVTLESGKTYTLKMMQRDGSVESCTVTNAPGAATVLTFSAIATAPAKGAVWQLEANDQVSTLWRMRKRSEEEGAYAIAAVQHDPGKYDWVENGVKFDPVPTSSIPRGELTYPLGLTYREFVKMNGEVGVPSILFSWLPVEDIRVVGFEAQVKRPVGDGYEVIPVWGGTSVEVTNITPGEHTLRVRSVDGVGRKSAWSALTDTFDGLPAPPEAPSNFHAYPGVDGVRFIWNPVTTSGHPLDYEIRIGASWAAGQYLCRVQGDTVTVKLPTSASVNQQYWLKAKVRGADVYSDNAAYATTYQANIPNVNIVVQENFQADSFAGGSTHRLEVVDLDGEDALKLSINPDTSSRYTHGDYRDEVDLGAVFYARCWLETTVRNVSEVDGPTWDDLNLAWDDLGDLSWTPADGPLSDVTLSPYISVDTVPSDLLEAWRLGTSNDGSISPTPATVDVLTDTAESVHGLGVELMSSSLLGWEANVPFTSTFTVAFFFTPSAVPSGDAVLWTATDGTAYLQVLYDYGDDLLVLVDENDDTVSVAAPSWATDDQYIIAVTQTATERRLMWVSLNENESAFAQGSYPPAAVLDTIYLGSAGDGNQETWEDAGYTWDDIETTRTWEELALVLFPTPGVYGDMTLSSGELTEANFEEQLVLRGPAGYSSYRPLIPGDYQFERAWVWQRLAAPAGVGQNIYLTESTLHVDVPDVNYSGSETIGAAPTLISFPQPYHEVPIVSAVVVGAGSPAIVEIVSKSASGFTAQLLDAATLSPVAGSFDWVSKGY